MRHANLLRLDMKNMSEKNANLLDEFARVQKLLSKYQLWYSRNFGPSGDPHRGQGRVLAILKLQPEISQKELSYLLDMRNQSLGELLGKLEKTGAITREPSDEDRRSMNIRLTESGAKLIEQGGKKQDDVSKVFECLSREDQDKLHEILNCLSGELEKQLGCGENSEKEKTKTKSGSRRQKDESALPHQAQSPVGEEAGGKHRGDKHREKQKG